MTLSCTHPLLVKSAELFYYTFDEDCIPTLQSGRSGNADAGFALDDEGEGCRVRMDFSTADGR
jgi:hypothetical protein